MKLILFTILLGTIFLQPFNVTAEEREKIFIHTDRDVYIAGENVFYSVSLYSTDSVDNQKSNVCYLILRDKNRVYNKLYIKASNGKSYGSFYLPDTLQTGYYEIVGFTNYMKNFGEWEYFRKNILIANRFDERLENLGTSEDQNNGPELSTENSIFTIYLEKDSFRVREKIRFEIKNSDLNFSKVSISVKENNPYSEYINSLNFQLHGNNNNSSVNESLFLKEHNGIYLTGELLSSDSTPIINECLYLSTPDTFPNLQYTFSNDKGIFQFFLPDYYLGKQLIIFPKEKKPGNCIIRLHDKTSLKNPAEIVSINISRELRRYILHSQNLVKIQKIYEVKNVESKAAELKNHRFPYVYLKPSTVVYPAEFSALKNLREISENITPSLRIRKENDEFKPFVFNQVSRVFFSTPATTFLNGVPVYNLNNLMSLSSSEIKKIEISKVPRIKGTISFSGIVSINTSTPMNPAEFIPGAVAFTMGSFSANSTYNPPTYSNQTFQNTAPDYRQLLYWNPDLELTENTTVEFFASDWPGEFVIEVAGINNYGVPILTFSKIKVYE